jgi:VanZ family protein
LSRYLILPASSLEAYAPPARRNLLVSWIPTIAWLCLLAMFSSDVFSAEHTGSILQKILQALFGEISEQRFVLIHFLLRKSAHFCSYGMLSAFAFFSWRATFPAFKAWSVRWSGLALLLTLVAASGDEFHQSFVPSRTSSPRDVLLDMVGAIFFQIAIAIWLQSRSAIKLSAPQQRQSK